MHADPERLCGIVLAAGRGTRFGGPKALAREPDGTPWVAIAAGALRAGGCGRVIVALSDAAAAPLVPAPAEPVVVSAAGHGLSATLRGALAAAATSDAVVILPVDTPGIAPAAIARVIAAAAGSPDALVQAVYDGRPGHPVLIGRRHFAPLSTRLAGDTGARPYLVAHGVTEVDCGDLWSGEDIDERLPQ